jgi:TRAP transporter TAXI family solute receptor
MRAAVRIAAALAAALLVLTGAAAQTPPKQPPQAIAGVIAGGPDGTYIRIAADLAVVLDDPRLRVLPMIGKGSVQNIDDLLHLRGVDIAIVQSDVLAFIRAQKSAPDVERKVNYITKLYDEEVHVLAGPGIERLEDLRDRRVNVDVRGSGTALTATTLFDALQIPIQVANDDQGTALQKLRNKEIDAVVYVAGRPVRLFSGLTAESGLHFLPVPLTPALLETYLPARLEHTDYPGLIADGATLDTVAVGAVMAVYAWSPRVDRYRMVTQFVDAFFRRFQEFKQPPRHPKWREVNLEAQVPGWSRFPPAEEWLKRRASAGLVGP